MREWTRASRTKAPRVKWPETTRGRKRLDSAAAGGMDLAYLTIREARGLLDRGDISSTELTEAALDRIYERDDSVEAFDSVTTEVARQAAADFDRRRAA